MYAADQKRAPDLITDGCEPPCGCWELNSGPLEEQVMLLTTEPTADDKGRKMSGLTSAHRSQKSELGLRSVLPKPLAYTLKPGFPNQNVVPSFYKNTL